MRRSPQVSRRGFIDAACTCLSVDRRRVAPIERKRHLGPLYIDGLVPHQPPVVDLGIAQYPIATCGQRRRLRVSLGVGRRNTHAVRFERLRARGASLVSFLTSTHPVLQRSAVRRRRQAALEEGDLRIRLQYPGLRPETLSVDDVALTESVSTPAALEPAPALGG